MKKLQKGGVKSFLKNIFLKPEENLPARMQTVLTPEDRQAYMDSLGPLTQTSTSQIDLRPPSNIVAPSPIPISTAPKIQTNYSGNSIVDYLKEAGINDTSLQSRRELGRSLGINNIGTAEGNLALLAKLRGENYVAPTKTSQRTTVKPATQRQIQKTSPRKDLNPHSFNEATGKSDYSNRNWTTPQNQTTSVAQSNQNFNTQAPQERPPLNIPNINSTASTYVRTNNIINDPSKRVSLEDIERRITSTEAAYNLIKKQQENYLQRPKPDHKKYLEISRKSGPARTREEMEFYNNYKKKLNTDRNTATRIQKIYSDKLEELQRQIAIEKNRLQRYNKR